jgi:hypothetical protein
MRFLLSIINKLKYKLAVDITILKNYANALRLIRSKIGLKIGILVVIQIIFIISSFSVLTYYNSQGTHLGNSINIAGKMLLARLREK